MQHSTKTYTLKSYEESLKSTNSPQWDKWYEQLNGDFTKDGWKKEFDGVIDKAIPEMTLKVSTKEQDDSPIIYTYQEAFVPGVEIKKFMKLMSDLESRKDFDDNVLEAKSLKKFNDTSDVLYMSIKMPMIMSDRDFLFERHTLGNKISPNLIKQFKLPECEEEYYIQKLSSIELEEQPITKKFIRAEMFQIILFKQVRPGLIKFTSISNTNLKGSIPKFLMNSFASKGAIEKMKKMLKQYKELDAKGKL